MANFDDTALLLGLKKDASCAECIKAIREMTRMNQTEFAQRYHIPRRTVQNWELGIREMPEYTLYMLARLVMAERDKR